MKFKNLKSKIAVVGVLTLGAAVSAHAALPAAAQGAVDGVGTFANDMIAWAWPVVAVVTVASIGIKLFKKFTSKAT